MNEDDQNYIVHLYKQCEKNQQDTDNRNMLQIITPYQLLEYDICPKKHYQCLIC